ncbi:hypothetical protein [Aquimonas voraii]|nr:hypothetical protein [Aquimonas voraii]
MISFQLNGIDQPRIRESPEDAIARPRRIERAGADAILTCYALDAAR